MPAILIRAVRAASVMTAAAIGSSNLVAQTIRGTVLDSTTSQAVPDVTIELLRADSQVVARESSDKKGQFRVRARAAGLHYLRARRIGYRTLELTPVVLAKGDTTLDLQLIAAPVGLAPVAVEVFEEPYLKRTGFYERKNGGAGEFLDPDAVEKLAIKARVIGDILQHIRGVRMVNATGLGGARIPHLRSCRSISQRLIPNPQSGQVQTVPDDPRRADGIANDPSLFPRIYVDGIAVGKEIFLSLIPDDILAVEVYMGASQIPLQYGGTDAPCGVILLWSKR